MFSSLAAFKTRFNHLTDETIENSSADETLAQQCLTDAYNSIRRILLARGISATAINQWSERENFELDTAMYFYGRRKGWEKDGEDDERLRWLRSWNRLTQLKTLSIVLDDGSIASDMIASKYGIGGANLDEVNQDLADSTIYDDDDSFIIRG